MCDKHHLITCIHFQTFSLQQSEIILSTSRIALTQGMYAKGMSTVKPINNIATPHSPTPAAWTQIKIHQVIFGTMFIHNKVTKQSTLYTLSNICHTHCMTLPVILLSFKLIINVSQRVIAI